MRPITERTPLVADEEVVKEGRFAFGRLIHINSFTIVKHILLLVVLAHLQYKFLASPDCVAPGCDCAWLRFFFGDVFGAPGAASCHIFAFLAVLSSLFTLYLASFVIKIQSYTRANRSHDGSKKHSKKILITILMIFTFFIELIAFSAWLYGIGVLAVRKTRDIALAPVLLTYLFALLGTLIPIASYVLHVIFCFHVCECFITNRDRRMYKSLSGVGFRNLEAKMGNAVSPDFDNQNLPPLDEQNRQRRVQVFPTQPKHPLPTDTLTPNTSKWIAERCTTSPGSMYAFESPGIHNNNKLSHAAAVPQSHLYYYEVPLSPQRATEEGPARVVRVSSPIDV